MRRTDSQLQRYGQSGGQRGKKIQNVIWVKKISDTFQCTQIYDGQ